jgi:tetratricopeptide (TPR) repeat protein
MTPATLSALDTLRGLVHAPTVRQAVFLGLMALLALGMLTVEYRRRSAATAAAPVFCAPHSPLAAETRPPSLQLGAPGAAATIEQALQLGQVYQRQGQASLAEHFYRTCLRLAPDHREANMHLAALLLEAARAPEAMLIYRQVLEGAPDDADALYNLGHAYFQLRLYPQAAQYWGRAAKLAQTAKDARTNLRFLKRLRQAEEVRRRLAGLRAT